MAYRKILVLRTGSVAYKAAFFTNWVLGLEPEKLVLSPWTYGLRVVVQSLLVTGSLGLIVAWAVFAWAMLGVPVIRNIVISALILGFIFAWLTEGRGWKRVRVFVRQHVPFLLVGRR